MRGVHEHRPTPGQTAYRGRKAGGYFIYQRCRCGAWRTFPAGAAEDVTPWTPGERSRPYRAFEGRL